MNVEKLNKLLMVCLLVLVSALVYLPFVGHFGYFNDDWYLMYAAGARGVAVFKDIYIIDRPLRAWVMSPAYVLFGNNPLLYNLSAWGFRVFSAVIFYYFLTFLWPRQRTVTWMSALLYLIYPGFLSQFNGIDYQSQMVSLAVGMCSLILLFYAYRTPGLSMRLLLFILLVVTTTFYLGLVEYFIGMEVFKVAVALVLVFRDESAWRMRAKKSIIWASYWFLTLLPFLVWRLFFFHSERGATDVNVKFSDVLAAPLAYLLNWFIVLTRNIIDVCILAWVSPLQRVSYQVTTKEWLGGVMVAGLVLLLIWMALKGERTPKNEHVNFSWRVEAAWLGTVMLVCGLLPVIVVGRYVDFRSFSRYALAPSMGVVLLLQAALSLVPNVRLRNAVYALLIIASSLTHYGNAITRERETNEMQNFWWQVTWRIPQLEQRTTLIANYPSITIEEDYFVWGPANLIYYLQSTHPDYPQPGIYAVLISEKTIEKVLARERQEYSERRGIRTYPNYRNILILSQPTQDSCVQVIDQQQPEYSSAEDRRLVQIGPYSESERIFTDEPFLEPPPIPFGSEPVHGWCYTYEKASFARQRGDWYEVVRLGEEAFASGLSPKDQIEWMPFLQGYALLGNSTRLSELSFQITDPLVREQACQILLTMDGIAIESHDRVRQLFCDA